MQLLLFLRIILIRWFLIRKRSPLCVGIGDDEMFVASDLMAFADKTKKVLFLPDESIAFVKKNRIELYDFSGNVLPMHIQEITMQWSAYEKRGHEHYMLKEIYEQKTAIHDTVDFLTFYSQSCLGSFGAYG